MADKKKRIIVVVGSGRSGTSAITRGLRVLGVDLGNNLMPAEAGVNDKGFWEDQDIYRINLEIFEALGRDWHNLGVLDFSKLDAPIIRDFKSRARGILSEKLAGTECFGLKDPQMARILPFWREVFAELSLDVSYVITCRSLDGAVPSLRRYTKFDDTKCIYLWFEYVLASLINTVGATRLVVDYDLMMMDPSAQLGRIAQNLDLKFAGDSKELMAYRDEFLDESLRHVKGATDIDQLGLTVPLYVTSMFRFLSKAAKGELDVDSEEAISYVAGVAAMQLGPGVQLANVLCELENTRASLISSRSTLDVTSSELKIRTHALDTANEELQSRTDELIQTRKLLIERTNVAEALRQELNARAEDLAATREILQEDATKLDKLSGDLADEMQEHVKTRGLLFQRTEVAENLDRELQERTSELVEVRELVLERTRLTEKLDVELRQATSELNQVRNALADSIARVDGLQAALVADAEELASVRKVSDERAEVAESLSREVLARTQELTEVRAELVDCKAQYGKVVGDLDKCTQELVSLDGVLADRAVVMEKQDMELNARAQELVAERCRVVQLTERMGKLDIELKLRIERLLELEDTLRLKEQLLLNANAELAKHSKKLLSAIWRRMRRG